MKTFDSIDVLKVQNCPGDLGFSQSRCCNKITHTNTLQVVLKTGILFIGNSLPLAILISCYDKYSVFCRHSAHLAEALKVFVIFALSSNSPQTKQQS